MIVATTCNTGMFLVSFCMDLQGSILCLPLFLFMCYSYYSKTIQCIIKLIVITAILGLYIAKMRTYKNQTMAYESCYSVPQQSTMTSFLYIAWRWETEAELFPSINGKYRVQGGKVA